MMRLTSGNVDFSEDLTQLSFLRALKYLNSYDQKKNFKNWLISIAVNCFKSEIKKESKYIPVSYTHLTLPTKLSV